MPTIRDVADLASVSTATVSHVVNNSRNVAPETRLRVERAIGELGFRPNAAGRSLARRKGLYGAAKPRANEEPAPAIPSPLLVRPAPPSGAEPSAGTTARAVLKLVRAAQPISRAEVARRLGVNRSTITEVVKPLLHKRVLREGDMPYSKAAHHIGRPPIGLVMNSEGEFFIGINIGVRQTHVGAATMDDCVLADETFDTPSDASDALTQIRSSVRRLRARFATLKLVSVGVSVPGPTCAMRRRLLYAPQLGWRDVAIADNLKIEQVTRTAGKSSPVATVVVENDATAAAMYEARRRLADDASREWRDFILVRAGTGIGVGLVLGGEVYRGMGTSSGIAGEFGHMTIVAGGKQCACGNRGCWERYASARSAAALYAGDRPQAGGAPPLRYADVVARAASGEGRARSTLERTGEYLGVGIANVVAGFGVTNVVVSGRIVLGWDFLKNSLDVAVRRAMAGRVTQIEVVAGAATGAGIGGALDVAIEHHLTSITTRSMSDM